MIKRAGILVAALLLTACTTEQITTTLEIAVDAAIAATSILFPQYAHYLGEAQNCMTLAATELESADPAAVKILVISVDCASAVNAGKVADPALQGVVTDLSAFLQSVAGMSTKGTPKFDPVKLKIIHAKLKILDIKLDAMR